VDIEDAVRMNAAGVAMQVFIGGEFETRSVHNMTRLVDAGNRYGIPVMGVTAVGKDMVRDAKYFRLACRICAELGAHYVKTYYVERTSRPSPPPARCRSSWPAARSCPSSTR
jgi:3-hydroxy-5-phosphonooxypentane-2,4-dione thiolase